MFYISISIFTVLYFSRHYIHVITLVTSYKFPASEPNEHILKLIYQQSDKMDTYWTYLITIVTSYFAHYMMHQKQNLLMRNKTADSFNQNHAETRLIIISYT